MDSIVIGKVVFVALCAFVDWLLLSFLQRWLFNHSEEVSEAVRESFTPGWLSALFGEYGWSRQLRSKVAILPLALLGLIFVERYLYKLLFPA